MAYSDDAGTHIGTAENEEIGRLGEELLACARKCALEIRKEPDVATAQAVAVGVQSLEKACGPGDAGQFFQGVATQLGASLARISKGDPLRRALLLDTIGECIAQGVVMAEIHFQSEEQA